MVLPKYFLIDIKSTLIQWTSTLIVPKYIKMVGKFIAESTSPDLFAGASNTGDISQVRL